MDQLFYNCASHFTTLLKMKVSNKKRSSATVNFWWIMFDKHLYTVYHFRCSFRRRCRRLYQDTRSSCWFFRRDGFLRARFIWTIRFHVFTLFRSNLLRYGQSACALFLLFAYSELFTVSGSFNTYFQTAKSEVEDNEDGEDDNNDTDDSNDINTIYTPLQPTLPRLLSRLPLTPLPAHNKTAYPKY